MVYSAVIFDMDGTLLDTLEDLADSVNYMLGRFGYPPKTKDLVCDSVGNGVSYLIERSLPNGLDDPNFEEAVRVYKEHYAGNCMNKTRPYPRIMQTLGVLKDAGVKSAIVSNKSDSAVKALNEAFFKDYIDVALGEAPGIKKKPAPDLILRALSDLRALKEEAVYVGDSEVDIMTAKNAGMRCISVSWGFREPGFLKESGAEIIIDCPGDIMKILERGFPV